MVTLYFKNLKSLRSRHWDFRLANVNDIEIIQLVRNSLLQQNTEMNPKANFIDKKDFFIGDYLGRHGLNSDQTH